ncbi:MAG: zinc ABC transporter substrate-binding protein [Clostridia bacterium]|nr:zinc ABC transporter substrate-binding protein [Clostridia bacterium]
MKKITAFLLALILSAGVFASAELEIVCSLFPQYDFARQIAGGCASITQLLPNGTDSHGYEPSMRDMLNTDGADLFIYTDELLEGWVESFSGGLSRVTMVRCADGIDLDTLNKEWEAASHAEGKHEHDHDHAYDAHIWLDPILAIQMVNNICDAMAEADPENAEIYRLNADNYIKELQALDSEFQALFSAYPDATLYFGGKFAYSHFLRRYHVGYVSAYATCSDEGEPSARTIVHMAETMKQEGAKAVFTDEMSSGQVAQALSGETGAKLLVFHTCHNLSKEDQEKGLTYIDIMRMNLENIRTAIAQ